MLRLIAFLRCLLLVPLLAGVALPSSAEPLALRVYGWQPSHHVAPHASFLEDQGGVMTVDEVASPAAAGHFQPVPPGAEVNFGYSAATYWLRFTLDPQADAPADWLLEVAFPSLDRIEFFVPSGSAYRKAVAGDLVPFSERPLANRNLVFPLRLAAGKPQTFFLRVASSGSLTVPLQLWQVDAFARHNQNAYAAFALYYGMLLALMLYNLLLYFSVRDRAYLTYVLFVSSMAVGQLSLNGLGNQYLWPEWPAWGNVALPVGFAATGFFGALFTRNFLATGRTVPALDRVILAMVLAFAVSALAPFVLSYRTAAILTSLSGMGFSAIAVVAGFACLSRGHAGARYFLIAWTLLLIGVAMMAMRNLGWLPTNFLTSYAMQIGSALEMLLLSFALADRINGLRREKEQAQSEALAAKQAMLETLRSSERELEARVVARTRELADANNRLRESEAQLQRLAHQDPLTGLANRLLLRDRLDHALDKAARSDTALAVLLIDLDDFKPINDGYGHATGDQVLVQIARRLRQSVRAMDSVARIGGDEFVVLLEDVHSADDIWQVANKLVAELARPVLLDGRSLSVTASVGVAIYPEDGTTPDALLQRADAAMYSAKGGGGHRCLAMA